MIKFGLDEVLPEIVKMWTENPYPGYEGKYFSMPERPVLPKPYQDPHPPIWMACTQPASYAVAPATMMYCAHDQAEALEMGGVAALWYGAQTAKLFAPWAGKDVKGYEYYTELVHDPEFVAQFTRPFEERVQDEYSLIGTPDKVAEGVQAYVDIGADQIICMIQAGRIPHERIMSSLRLFGEEVLPRFRER